MKYGLLLCVLLLPGCGWEYSELQAAKASCARYNGNLVIKTTGNLITGIHCEVDGIRYRIGRDSFDLMEGRK